MFDTYNKVIAITKSDTVNFPSGLTDAVYIGGAGDLVVVTQDDATATVPCIAGQVFRVKAKRINSTSTTATGLFALYKV